MEATGRNSPLVHKRPFAEMDDKDGIQSPSVVEQQHSNIPDRDHENSGDREAASNSASGEGVGAATAYYSGASESDPEVAIYDRAIPAMGEGLSDILRGLLRTFKNHQYRSPHAISLVERLTELLHASLDRTVKIAILGAAGAGKSSLINSITDIPGLAKSLSGGGSCTNMPVEYQGPLTGQMKKFGARIIYRNKHSIRDLLEKLQACYHLFYFDHDEGWDHEQELSYQKQAESAFRMLRTLSLDKTLQETEQIVKSLLETSYRDKSNQFIDHMMDICERRLKPDYDVSHETYIETKFASTQVELRRLIDPLMGSPSNTKVSSFWPLVERVQICVCGPQVLENATFVDLPGVSDTNHLRISESLEYVKQCDGLIICVRIDRAIDDDQLHRHIASNAQRFDGKIAVVLTRSDDNLDSDLADDLRDEGFDVEKYDECTQNISDKDHEITEIEEETSKLEEKLETVTLDPEDRETLMKSIVNSRSTRLPLLERSKDQLETCQYGLLAAVRGEYVSRNLRERYDRFMPRGQTLPISVISNIHYSLAKDRKRGNVPLLSVEATGIPSFQAYCLSLPAPFLYDALQTRRNDLRLVIENMKLWAEKTDAACRSELLKHVQKPQKLLALRFNARRASVTESIDQGILRVFRNRHSSMKSHALKRIDQKKSLNASTVRTFIRHRGRHSTRLQPMESWNHQFSEKAKDIMKPYLADLTGLHEKCNAQVEERIVRDLADVVEHTKRDISTSDTIKGHLAGFLDASIQTVRDSIQNNKQDYKKDLRAIDIDATEDSGGNYFGQTMTSVYDACSGDRGKGVTERSLRRIREHLEKRGSSSPFAILADTTGKVLKQNDSKHMACVEQQVGQILANVYESFERVVTQRKDDLEEDAARDAIKQSLPEIEAHFTRVSAAIDAVKANYPL